MNTLTKSFGVKGLARYQFQPNQADLMVILPGGGYAYTSDREGQPVADAFYKAGYHTVILDYSTEGDTAYVDQPWPDNPASAFPQPLIELATLIKDIRKHKKDYLFESQSLYIIGFSAGANLASLLGVYYNQNWLKESSDTMDIDLKPDALLLAYPPIDTNGLSDNSRVASYFHAALGDANPSLEQIRQLSPLGKITCDYPDTFIWHTNEDKLVSATNSLKLATALAEAGVPYELHIYETGPHGLSLATEASATAPYHINDHAASWLPLALGWLAQK